MYDQRDLRSSPVCDHEPRRSSGDLEPGRSSGDLESERSSGDLEPGLDLNVIRWRSIACSYIIGSVAAGSLSVIDANAKSLAVEIYRLCGYIPLVLKTDSVLMGFFLRQSHVHSP